MSLDQISIACDALADPEEKKKRRKRARGKTPITSPEQLERFLAGEREA